MNLWMKSAEYQAIMKEMGYTRHATASSRGSSADQTQDVFLAHVTLRLDDESVWQKMAANLAVQWLDLGRDVVQSVQVVAYATAACLLLHGTAHVLRVLLTTTSRRDENKNDDAMKP